MIWSTKDTFTTGHDPITATIALGKVATVAGLFPYVENSRKITNLNHFLSYMFFFLI